MKDLEVFAMEQVFGGRRGLDPPPSVLIRSASATDAEAISVILECAFAEYKALYTSEAFLATVLSPEGIRGRIWEGPVWVAERESAIIGTVAALSSSDFVMVRGMAVHPVARGLGVAKGLLNEVEKFARRNGQEQLSLYTTPFLTQAIRLYEASGFRFTGETASPHGTRLLHMQKTLDSDGTGK
jgi:GNAT superfamily N-acetyltransferase